MMHAPIYLDYCATTPCDQRVADHMMPYFTRNFGNAASRDHSYGWLAREAVELAREQVAQLVHAKPKQIVFTSGATESVNLALKGLAEAHPKKTHIVTAGTEHKAVLETCDWLEQQGFSITRLATDGSGHISLDELERSICNNTLCIALMYANNETGVIHPIAAAGAIAKKHGVFFVCDATQAVGKIPVDVDGIDLVAFSSHKLYGPMGVGALFIRNEVKIFRQQHGGAHEKRLRGGTLNTPGIAGFGKAAEICRQEMHAEAKRLQQLRDRLEGLLLRNLEGASVNGNSSRTNSRIPPVIGKSGCTDAEGMLPDGSLLKGHAERLPHVTNILFPGIDAEQLLLAVSGKLALSRGSACNGLVQQPSHVLLAMGLSHEEAASSVRISLGRHTTENEINLAAEILIEAVQRINTLHERAETDHWGV